jgi:hypothetical protein
VKAGETIELTVPDSSGADTRIYIQGVDWTEDIGDLSDLQVSADNPQLSVASKRLQRLKVGDEDASKVTTNVQALNFGECPSMIIVDAMNAKSLTGTIDLSKMPRLMEAYFGGTGVKAVNVPNGSKIAVLELGEETTQISLMNLKFMEAGRKGGALDLVWTNGKYLTAGDTIGSNSNYRYCDYVNIVGQEYILVDGYFGEDNGLHFYASDKSVIKFVSSKTIGIVGQTYGTKILVPEGAVYVRMSGTISAELNIVIQGKRGFTYTSLPKLEFLRIENCSQLNPFTMLKSIYNTDGNVIRDIRIIGFDVDGDASDATMIANLANDVDKDGNPHIYNGIDAEGKPMDNSHPVIEGRLSINGNIYEDDYAALKAVFSNLVMEFLGFYVAIKDPKVLEVLLANITTDDGIGLTREDIEGVTNIGTWFVGNTEIETFDEFERFTSVKKITNAFRDATSLRTIKFPEGLETISGQYNDAYGCFQGCTSLERVTFPEGLIALANANNFSGCTSLTSVNLELPNLTEMGVYAFGDCPSLIVENINLPKLTSIGVCAFYGGANVKKIESLGKITSLPSLWNERGVFHNNTLLESVNLPDTLTNIGAHSFNSCSSLKNINFPESVKTIGDNAFHNCTSLSFDELNLPNLTSLGPNAFYGVKIKKLGLPSLLTLPSSDYYYITYGDKATLEEIVLAEGLTSIPRHSFYSYTKLHTINLPSSVTAMGYSVFYNCSSLAMDIEMPNLTSIDYTSFMGSGILSFSAPVLTKLSGVSTFEGCKALRTVSIPAVTSITNKVFKGCTALETVDASSVTTMSYDVFNGCSSLKKVVLGAITSIDYNAFYGCKALEEVIVTNETPGTLGNGVFGNTNTTFVIYVPDASVDTYKEASGWSAYADRIYPLSVYEAGGLENVITFADPAVEAICLANFDTDGNGIITKDEAAAVTSIGTVFRENKTITSFDELKYFTGVTSLVADAFADATNIETISLPPNCTIIGSAAFWSCSKLATINGLEQVTSVGSQGFLTVKITSLSLPNYQGAIAERAFSYCSNLEVADLGAGVTQLSGEVFSSDTKLATLIVRATTPPTLVGANFYQCPLSVIYVPDASVDAYKNASNWSAYASLIKPLSQYNG